MVSCGHNKQKERIAMKETEKTTATVTNREIRESGVMPQIIRAMEHDPLETPDIHPEAAYTAVEKGVVGTYKAIEQGVVDAYRAVETGVVAGYKKVEDTMVDKFFRREGETMEQTRERLRRNG